MTAALPYANGDIHLGHLVEYVQADIWARFQKLRGNECYFICADDAHGTPVMLRAEAEKTDPETLIERMRESHTRDFSAFNIEFDCYHSTHSPENRHLSEDMYRKLRNGGFIEERTIQQLYDEKKGMFLPDRYVRGECPKCGAAEQYGDSCEVCGAAYSSAELKNPRSALSGARPALRESRHYFLRLDALRAELDAWTQEEIPDPAGFSTEPVPRLQKEAANKMREWLDAGLRDWDISRDPPYFGFRIPECDEEKYFYVWLDAPIGYMASFKHLCESGKNSIRFEDFWNAEAEEETELYHFIGKDILYFHALFWPAMLKSAGYRRPTRIFAHGFLTVDGEKMSKSRGTFITARRYLDCGLDPEFLRYYYACKLGDRMDDIDLSLRDFSMRSNGDLVGKLVNIPSRVAGFLGKIFDGRLDDADTFDNGEDAAACIAPALDAGDAAAAAFESRRYHEAMRLVMRAADAINARIDTREPWNLAKDESRRAELHAICSAAMRGFHLLMVMLAPVLPGLARKAEELLNVQLEWTDELKLLEAGHAISPYKHLLKRMPEKAIAALVVPERSGDDKAEDASAPAEITVDEFARSDLRIASVLSAEAVEGADKLLKLSLDIGDDSPRQVFAGIKAHCDPAALAGRRVLYLANLKPRKMRFGESQGMVLAAGDGSSLWLVEAPGAPAGAKVR